MKYQIIKKALERFKEVLENLDCECDYYNGYTCTIHNDERLVDEALNELKLSVTKTVTKPSLGYPEGR